MHDFATAAVWQDGYQLPQLTAAMQSGRGSLPPARDRGCRLSDVLPVGPAAVERSVSQTMSSSQSSCCPGPKCAAGAAGPAAPAWLGGSVYTGQCMLQPGTRLGMVLV